MKRTNLDDNARALVLACLEHKHSPEEARRILDAGDRAVLLANLRRSIANHDHALMELHPHHPRRPAITLDRAQLVALVEQLAGEALP
jgi:hypothetical protein